MLNTYIGQRHLSHVTRLKVTHQPIALPDCWVDGVLYAGSRCDAAVTAGRRVNYTSRYAPGNWQANHRHVNLRAIVTLHVPMWHTGKQWVVTCVCVCVCVWSS